jgi:hypothetical protein
MSEAEKINELKRLVNLINAKLKECGAGLQDTQVQRSNKASYKAISRTH